MKANAQNSIQKQGKSMKKAKIVVFIINILAFALSIAMVHITLILDIKAAYHSICVWTLVSTGVLLLTNLIMGIKSKKIAVTYETNSKAFRVANAENQEIIEALSTNYTVVVLLNFNNDMVKFLRLSNSILRYMQDEFSQKQNFDFYLTTYANKVIPFEYRDSFFRTISSASLKEKLATREKFVFNYVAEIDGERLYHQMRAAWLNKESGLVAIGFSNVDEELRENAETYEHVLRENERLREALHNKKQD